MQNPKPQFHSNEDPSVPERNHPADEYVRKGRSPHWLCFVAECLQSGKFFHLKWPAGVGLRSEISA